MKCGAVALVVIAAAARTASASPIRLATSGDACSIDALEPRLTALVGTDPVDPAAAATVSFVVSRERGAYRASITFDDGNGHVRGPRVVASTSCRELVDAVALVIAMALPELQPAPTGSDASTPSAASTPAASAASTSTPTRSTPPTAAAVTPPAHDMAAQTRVTAASDDAPARPTTFAIVAGGAGGLTSHGAQAGILVGARVQRGAVSLGAEVRADAPAQVSVGTMGQIDVMRAQLSFAPCLHVDEMAGCVVASVGTFRGSGDGLVAGRSAYTPLFAGGLRLAWEHALTARVGVRVHFDVDALATTTRFDVDRMTVWASPRFEAGTGIGIVAHFP